MDSYLILIPPSLSARRAKEFVRYGMRRWSEDGQQLPTDLSGPQSENHSKLPVSVLVDNRRTAIYTPGAFL